MTTELNTPAIPHSPLPPTSRRLTYAEVTIIKNVDNSNFLNSIQWFLGLDTERIIDSEKDIVLMSFENEPPFDTKDRYVDFKFNIQPCFDNARIMYITYTEEDKRKFYFSQEPTFSKGRSRLNFSRVTNENPSYKNSDIQPSHYNTIFYCYESGIEKDALFIAKLISSDSKPRYVIAYDDNYITKLQVIYLVRTIFLELYIFN
jgi:hypothetical protein